MLARLSLLFAFMMFLTSGVLRVAKPAPPAGGLLVVANQKEHTLLLVDPENRRELAKIRSEEHTSELQSRLHIVCRLLLEKKKIAFVAERELRVLAEVEISLAGQRAIQRQL